MSCAGGHTHQSICERGEETGVSCPVGQDVMSGTGREEPYLIELPEIVLQLLPALVQRLPLQSPHPCRETKEMPGTGVQDEARQMQESFPLPSCLPEPGEVGLLSVACSED